MTQPPIVPGQPQPTPYAYSPPPPGGPPAQAAKSKTAFWLRGPGIILVIVAVGLALFGIVALTGGLKAGTAADDDLSVTMTSCEFTGSDSLPSAKVGLTVTNNGDRTRSVTIGIEYRDSSGARIDTDTARVRNVAPGDTVRTEETTLLDAGAPTGRCQITSIR